MTKIVVLQVPEILYQRLVIASKATRAIAPTKSFFLFPQSYVKLAMQPLTHLD